VYLVFEADLLELTSLIFFIELLFLVLARTSMKQEQICCSIFRVHAYDAYYGCSPVSHLYQQLPLSHEASEGAMASIRARLHSHDFRVVPNLNLNPRKGHRSTYLPSDI
jgi:hypothetical protein